MENESGLAADDALLSLGIAGAAVVVDGLPTETAVCGLAVESSFLAKSLKAFAPVADAAVIEVDDFEEPGRFLARDAGKAPVNPAGLVEAAIVVG